MSKKLNRLENLDDAINYDTNRSNEDLKSSEDKNEVLSEKLDEPDTIENMDPSINASPKSPRFELSEQDENVLMSKISLVGDNVLEEKKSNFISMRNLKKGKFNLKLKISEKIDYRWNYLKINFYHIGML